MRKNHYESSIMSRSIRILTEKEFDSTVAYMRLSKENMALVKKVLLHGVPVSLVAKEMSNKSSQAVEKAVRRVWCKFLESQSIPKGWVSIRVCLPIDEALKVKTREKELKQQLIKKNILEGSY
jgi:hypothetical protein